MSDRRFEVPIRESGACRILMNDVRQDVELERLIRHAERLRKAPRLVMGEVELPEEHRVGRSIERRARRESLSRETAALRR